MSVILLVVFGVGGALIKHILEWGPGFVDKSDLCVLVGGDVVGAAACAHGIY